MFTIVKSRRMPGCRKADFRQATVVWLMLPMWFLSGCNQPVSTNASIITETQQEAGSVIAKTETNSVAVDEAGSITIPGDDFPDPFDIGGGVDFPEAGSTTLDAQPPAEAGSSIGEVAPEESGSTTAGPQRPATSTYGFRIPTDDQSGIRGRLRTVFALTAWVLILIVGFSAVFFFLRRGAVSPIATEKWKQQADLCCELLQQMRSLLQAAQNKRDRSMGTALEAIDNREPRRLLLLNNDVNHAVEAFVSVARECVGAADNAGDLARLRSRYLAAVDAMRAGIIRNEKLSLEIKQRLAAPMRITLTPK